MTRLEPVAVRLVQPDWAHRVSAPAHDSLAPAERRRYLAANPDSYLAVTAPTDDLPSSDRPVTAAELGAKQAALDRLLAVGSFGEVRPAAFYLYRLAVDGHAQVGIVGLVATDDYEQGVVRVHEHHVDERAQAIARHVAHLGVQSSPIALTHSPTPLITDVASDVIAAGPPAVDLTTDDGIHEQVWPIDAPPAIERIRAAIGRVPLYVIDGHHRAAAMAAHRRRSGSAGAAWMLAVLFPSDQLRNLAFHRCLDGTGIDVQRLLAELEQRYAVRSTTSTSQVAERGPDELALLTDRHWHLVRVPGDGAAGQLDPVRLAEHVIGSQPGLSYVPGQGDQADLKQLANTGHRALWAMRPVPIDTLMSLADDGLVLPPKSTYFVPKVRSGIFLRHLQ